jgi:steroid 5-alpha reductase family enzyme
VTLLQLALAILLTGAALSLVMALGWMIQQRSGNSGWVDACWSLSVGTVAAVVAIWPLEPNWPHWRQAAVAILALAWGLRLGLHIVGRARTSPDDPRYRDLIQQWGRDAPRRMFLFLQSQAAVGVVLAVSIALAAHNPNPVLRLQDIAGFAILLVAIAGEAIADRQLRAFKANPQNRGKICDVGLWSLSRHPNYFFEWLTWTAYPVIAIDFAGHNPYGWLALAAPACMYWVLVHVSGIPPLERHMLRTRGDEFRHYQHRTRAFFPFPQEISGFNWR